MELYFKHKFHAGLIFDITSYSLLLHNTNSNFSQSKIVMHINFHTEYSKMFKSCVSIPFWVFELSLKSTARQISEFSYFVIRKLLDSFCGQDSIAGIGNEYELYDHGVRIRLLQDEEFYFLHAFQTSWDVHPTSYTMGMGKLFLWG